MPTQQPTVMDTISSLNQRVTTLENAGIDDNQPVDMYRGFDENVSITDEFSVSTHKYHVCQGYVFVAPGQIEASLPCSANLKI